MVSDSEYEHELTRRVCRFMPEYFIFATHIERHKSGNLEITYIVRNRFPYNRQYQFTIPVIINSPYIIRSRYPTGDIVDHLKTVFNQERDEAQP